MWCRIALKYPLAYSSQVCSIYYQNVVNGAAYKKKPVDGHPLLKTGKEAFKLGRVPHALIKDLEEYLKFVEMCTAKHNAEAGDKDLAFMRVYVVRFFPVSTASYTPSVSLAVRSHENVAAWAMPWAPFPK